MTRPTSPPPGLPRGIRFAAVVGFLLSAFMGFFSLNEALELTRLPELREASATARFPLVDDPALAARITQARLSALESMSESRALILGALSVACALVFVSSGRLLRPDGTRLEGMRRLLGGSTLAVAVLRTLDGAQDAVVAQRMGPVTLELMRGLSTAQEQELALFQSMPWLFSVGTVLLTALLVGTFSLLSQYFRSERVRLAVVAQDGDLSEEEE